MMDKRDTRSRKLGSELWLWLARPAFGIAVIAIWAGYVTILDVPSYFLPHPFDVARELVSFVGTGRVWPHLFATVTEAGLGFLLGSIAALCTGVLISRSPFLEDVLRPYVIASQTTPIIVIAPLFLVWFGFGLLSKVLIAALICFFPVLVNVMAGLGAVSETERRLFRSLEANPWQLFSMLEVRRALPFIFAGLRVACILSIIGAVVGEFVGAHAGLGYVALTAAGNLQTELLFVAVIILMLVGITFYNLIVHLQKRIIFWE